jgi:hypothetical protein
MDAAYVGLDLGGLGRRHLPRLLPQQCPGTVRAPTVEVTDRLNKADACSRNTALD